ncbi:helix-turn-helix domain-containing protein [Colwellia sp. TT2012]|uniref:helix-turn-helix domain-containing protein n=1 Tax=Colwellia sp. TT2012 TaxID=1720342 RepID=UPI00070C2369|nr:helix-turn-helix transcriptional regulator [Colwellia sp. TT2012]
MTMNVGKQIRKIRTQQGMTVKQLSEICSVPEKTIYRIETGEVQDPKISSIEPIIRALNCSADEILFSHDDYYKFGELRQVFANITQMREPDQEMLIRMIRMVSLASSFEKQISENSKDLVKIK